MSGQVYSLAALSITTALTSSAQTAITSLDGITAVTLESFFQYGAGGTTCSVTVQTSLDGSNWTDVCRFDFTTATARKVANLNGLLSKAVTAVSTLGSESVTDGVLGDNLRAVVTSTGTYSNTTISVRASTR